MFQFSILSGDKAGRILPIRQFPCSLGRSGAAQIQLTESGIWDRHCRLDLRDRRLNLESLSEALTLVNGRSVQSSHLKAGDILELGSLKLQLELSPPVPKSNRLREYAFWTFLTAVCLAQILVIYLLA